MLCLRQRLVLLFQACLLSLMQVYVVGDNFRLVPRSSTCNITAAGGGNAADAAAAAADVAGARGEVLPFDSSLLRASSKRDAAVCGSSSSSGSDTNPVFSSLPLESGACNTAPPLLMVKALLLELQKLDISMCVVYTSVVYTNHS
jgi:hypothetical protein